jgi:selenocysteine-specific translation elongation factor
MRTSAKTGEGIDEFRAWLKALPARFFEDDEHEHSHGEHTHTHEHADPDHEHATA